jgi:predicted double-glycine peptidase
MRRLFVALCLCGLVLAAEKPGVWLDVPFVRQEKDGCGAASIAMVMQYWSRQLAGPDAGADAGEIQRMLYSKEGHGIYASDLEHYFQAHGFQTFAFHGEWDDLKQHLEKGRPLIVALRANRRTPEPHYVVVTGLDWEHNIVLVNDPAQRKLLKQERQKFEKQWSAVDKWMLLAVPHQQAH